MMGIPNDLVVMIDSQFLALNGLIMADHICIESPTLISVVLGEYQFMLELFILY